MRPRRSALPNQATDSTLEKPALLNPRRYRGSLEGRFGTGNGTELSQRQNRGCQHARIVCRGKVICCDLCLICQIIRNASESRDVEESRCQKAHYRKLEWISSPRVDALVSYHCADFVFREETLELSRQEDPWPPPAGRERRIRQLIDDIDGLDGLTRSFRCPLKYASLLRVGSPKASEYMPELPRRSKPIPRSVDQPHEQQPMKSFMDRQEQQLESDHAQTEQMIPIRSEGAGSRDEVMSDDRGRAE